MDFCSSSRLYKFVIRPFLAVDETLSKPLAEYISLTISRVVCGSDESHEPVPFILRRLVSRQYHVGPEGAVIGSSPEANVSLPQDAGLWDKHVEIKWISGILFLWSCNPMNIILRSCNPMAFAMLHSR